MGLPWARLDSNIATHPKLLAVCASARGQQAAATYMFSIAWAVGNATDGHIPPSALPVIHGTRALAQILVAHGLWEQNGSGWLIHNFAERQQVDDVSQVKHQIRKARSVKANCVRWHGPACHCWKRLTVLDSS